MGAGEDLRTMRDAVLLFRQEVMSMAGRVEMSAQMQGSSRDVEAEGWTPPEWVIPNSASIFHVGMRVLDAGEPVLRRVLDGFEAPDVDDILAVKFSRDAYFQARDAFIAAAGRVAVEYGAHGQPYPGRLEDGSAPRRVAPGTFPAQAEAALPEARAALRLMSLHWLAWSGRVEGATFLPWRAA